MADPEGRPTAPGSGPLRGAGMIVLAIAPPLTGASIPRLCRRVGVLLERTTADVVVCDVGAIVQADALTVDALARLQLTARRLGGRVVIRHACGELRDLLAFAGLGDVLPPPGELALEPGGQAEQREPPGGIEEEGDPADPLP